MPQLNIKTGDLLAADFYIIYLQPIRAIIESISMLKTGGRCLPELLKPTQVSQINHGSFIRFCDKCRGCFVAWPVSRWS